MSASNIDDFRKRLNKFEKGGRGWRAILNGRSRRGPGKGSSGLQFPRFPVILVLAMIFGMKAMIVLHVGEYEYQKRLGTYYDPSIGEQIGLYVMRADPFTLKLRDLAEPIFIR